MNRETFTTSISIDGSENRIGEQLNQTGYILVREDNDAGSTHYIRPENRRDYPRFHLILEDNQEALLVRVISFHYDQREHFTRQDQEVIIKLHQEIKRMV